MNTFKITYLFNIRSKSEGFYYNPFKRYQLIKKQTLSCDNSIYLGS